MSFARKREYIRAISENEMAVFAPKAKKRISRIILMHSLRLQFIVLLNEFHRKLKHSEFESVLVFSWLLLLLTLSEVSMFSSSEVVSVASACSLAS